MAILNDNLLNDLFDDADVARYDGNAKVAKKTPYLTAGPGRYELALSAYKTGTGESEKRFGQSYVVFEFEVLKAEAINDSDGKSHAPTHQPGATVSMVKYVSGRISVKEAMTMTACILGIPPVLAVPSGPHEGKILPMVDNATFERCSEDEGAGIVGNVVQADIVPKEGKGKHAGRTFFNCYAKPAAGSYPTADELVEKGLDIEGLATARFG